MVAVSVNEAYNKLEISVSPNPINQTANISFTAPESGMFSLTVTTQTGQVMYTANTWVIKGIIISLTMRLCYPVVLITSF